MVGEICDVDELFITDIHLFATSDLDGKIRYEISNWVKALFDGRIPALIPQFWMLMIQLY
jgi:hypothetical protein